MRVVMIPFLLALFSVPCGAQEGWRWDRSGTVQFPTDIFSANLGATERYEGTKFGTKDGRSTLAIYSFNNTRQENPRAYLTRTLVVDPTGLIYKRITRRFFVISDIRRDDIYYSRCNFGRQVRCIYMQYPAEQKRQWDSIVTRMSHSLR